MFLPSLLECLPIVDHETILRGCPHSSPIAIKNRKAFELGHKPTDQMKMLFRLFVETRTPIQLGLERIFRRNILDVVAVQPAVQNPGGPVAELFCKGLQDVYVAASLHVENPRMDSGKKVIRCHLLANRLILWCSANDSGSGTCAFLARCREGEFAASRLKPGYYKQDASEPLQIKVET